MQTPWLTAFLKDPYAIRPAVQLRMPRFHYGKPTRIAIQETEDLANYFAARDRAEFPYQTIPERTPSYLAQRDKAHPDYLRAGWQMMTNKGSPASSAMRSASSSRPAGEQVVNGPDLQAGRDAVPPRLLENWIANPKRLVPYTAMPQNIVPHGARQIPVPKTFENQPIDMVRRSATPC